MIVVSLLTGISPRHISASFCDLATRIDTIWRSLSDESLDVCWDLRTGANLVRRG
jgi:hypothetical protein